ncbi:hypothetical protein Bca4012_033429 [Brassica carinata]
MLRRKKKRILLDGDQLVRIGDVGRLCPFDGRNIILQHLGKVIGNGNSTKLWHDPWLSVSTPMAALGHVSIDEKDLMVSDVMTRETGMWNKEALLKNLPELIEDILHLQPNITGAEDGYAWLLNPSGAYTSKSGYLVLQLENAAPQRTKNIPDDFNWFKSVWNTETLPKIQPFLWKVLQNAIPTSDNLQKRGVLINTSCLRCGSTTETKTTCSSIVILLNRYGTLPRGLLGSILMEFGSELQSSRSTYHH